MSVTAHSLGQLRVEIQAGNHRWIADEPPTAGGEDAGPNPYDLLLGALAACKLITVQMYAQRKGWPLDTIEIHLEHRKINASECDDCQTDGSGKVDIIETAICFGGELSPEQLARLYEISDRCPVHRTLTSETKIRSTLLN